MRLKKKDVCLWMVLCCTWFLAFQGLVAQHKEVVAPSRASHKSALKIVLVGLPGAGKGIQSRALQKALNLPIIGMGDLLRKEVESETALGQEIKTIMDKGDFVSDDIAVQVFTKNAALSDGFIADGFPRNAEQASLLRKSLKEKGQKLDYIFYLDVPENVLVKRLTQRIVCLDCGAPQTKVKPAACISCGGAALGKRSDDQEEVVLKRIRDQKERNKALLQVLGKMAPLCVVAFDEEDAALQMPYLATQRILAHIKEEKVS